MAADYATSSKTWHFNIVVPIGIIEIAVLWRQLTHAIYIRCKFEVKTTQTRCNVVGNQKERLVDTARIKRHDGYLNTVILTEKEIDAGSFKEIVFRFLVENKSCAWCGRSDYEQQ